MMIYPAIPFLLLVYIHRRIVKANIADGNGVEGNFVTRVSGRQHMRPLAFWRNEKVEYRKGAHSAEISGVIHVPVEPVVPFAVKRTKARARARARSGSAKPKSSAGRGNVGGGLVHPEAGWDDMTTPLGKVIDFETGLETERREFFFWVFFFFSLLVSISLFLLLAENSLGLVLPLTLFFPFTFLL